MKTLRELFRKRKKPYERMETVNLNEIYVTRKEYNTMMEMLGQIAGKSIDLHDFHLSQAGLLRDVVKATNLQTEAIQNLLVLVDRLSLRIDRDGKEETNDTTLAEDLKNDTLSTLTKLRTPIGSLGFSVRAYSLLKGLGITDVANLVCQDRRVLAGARRMGRKTLAELDDCLQKMGLGFGMDLAGYGYERTETCDSYLDGIVHVSREEVQS